MYVHVPAMRGKIGSRTYYACLMPMSAIPNLFKFTDWVGFTPEDREQRVLNEKRVPELRDYINDNDEDYIFSSITASYKSQPVFDPAPSGNGMDGAIGVLKLKLGDELIINDGQHRCAGITEALKDNPSIGEHTISVLLFAWESKERVQQMFSDLNRYVQKTSKSLDILYDKRDKISAATLTSLDQVPVFRDLTDKDSVSLKSKSTKLFTLAALYDANRELLKGREHEAIADNAKILNDYWSTVAENMLDWVSVQTHHKEASELRAEKISSHSTALRALGGLGQELMKDENWRNRLASLQNIDWSKKNSDWENICIVANSVVSNRQARAATKAYIKYKLNMPVSDAELRSINKEAAKTTVTESYMSKKRNIHVVPHTDGWATKKEGAGRAGVVTDTQKQAIERAREQAQRERAEVVIHGRDNKIRDSDSYGEDPYPPKDKKH